MKLPKYFNCETCQIAIPSFELKGSPELVILQALPEGIDVGILCLDCSDKRKELMLNDHRI